MQTRLTAVDRPLPFVMSLGSVGGAMLVITALLTTKGPLIFLPYAALLLATALFLVAGRVQPFGARFLVSMGTFMVASTILYVYLVFVATGAATELRAWGHLWRLGVLVACGAASGAAIAQLTGVVASERT